MHSQSPPDLLDQAQLQSFSIIGMDACKELIDDMVLDVPGFLDKITASLVAGDSAACRESCHALRGMLLNFGCAAIAGKLLRLERSFPGPEEDPRAIAADLRACWVETRSALDLWLSVNS